MAVIDDVKAYLVSIGVPVGRYTDPQLSQVIATETAAQARKCNPSSSPDLAEALSRRVVVNLARRGLTLGVIEQASDGAGPSFVPRLDAEVRRLEAPYRKLVVG